MRLWDVGTRRAVGSPLSAHNGRVSGVAFARDGEMMASASADGTVRLWDAGRRPGLSLAITAHEGRVPSVSFSSDGRTLASAGYDDQTVRLWDARSHRVLGGPLPIAPILIGGIEISFPFVPVAVAFSPDGRSLAAVSHHDATIRLWDTRRRRPIGPPMIGFSGAFAGGLAFSPDGRTLAVLGQVGDRHTVQLWSVQSRRPIGALPSAHTREILSVAFSPDGRTLATGSLDRTVRLWDVGTRRPLGGPLIGHSDLVYRVVFSPDGEILASASSDATVRLWNVKERNALGAPLAGHTGGVEAVAFSPDGRTLASAAYDDTRAPVGRPCAYRHRRAAHRPHRRGRNRRVRPGRPDAGVRRQRRDHPTVGPDPVERRRRDPSPARVRGCPASAWTSAVEPVRAGSAVPRDVS